MMKEASLFLFTIAFILNTFFQFSAIANNLANFESVKIQIVTDRQDALYKCGEKVIFRCTITENDKLLTNGKTTVRISNDGMKTISTQEVDLAQNNPFNIEGTMVMPGFLQCEVRININKGYAGAGFEPDKIKPATIMPEDFNSFWNDGISELDKIPSDAKLELLPKFSTQQFDCFKISFANIDNTRIYGFMSIPKNRKGPFPVLVTVSGAGPGYRSPDIIWVRNGVIVLMMNVHQYDPPTDAIAIKKKYDELNKLQPYYLQGSPNKDQYYFKKSILGINRAINWLAKQPEVDIGHFALQGISQGGALTMIIAGLNKNIKAASASVPALCDHAGYQLNRTPGWPRLVTNNDPVKLKMSGYFDVVNFARSITCPIIVSVGFIDTTCSPSSVYAAYNTIQSPKIIFNQPTRGHDYTKEFDEYQTKWLKDKLGLNNHANASARTN